MLKLRPGGLAIFQPASAHHKFQKDLTSLKHVIRHVVKHEEDESASYKRDFPSTAGSIARNIQVSRSIAMPKPSLMLSGGPPSYQMEQRSVVTSMGSRQIQLYKVINTSNKESMYTQLKYLLQNSQMDRSRICQSSQYSSHKKNQIVGAQMALNLGPLRMSNDENHHSSVFTNNRK